MPTWHNESSTWKKRTKKNKENAKFFAQQLIQQQDATKNLNTAFKNKSSEQTPTTDSEKMTAATKAFMKFTTFANGGKGSPNPNATGKQHLWQGKKPYIANNLPNGEQLQHRHPDNNKSYCYKCGFDLPPGHTSKTCKYKTKNHKGEATIKNRMGGSTKNCFHHPNWATLKNKS